MAVSGLGVAMATAGSVLMLSGVRNVPLQATVRDLLGGKIPTASPTGAPSIGLTASPAAAAGSGSSSAATAPAPSPAAATAAAKANQAIAQTMLFASGRVTWMAGQQWQDLVALWNKESGWYQLAQNPDSGAFGVAQALGHGVAGSAGKYGNNYPTKAANDGDAASQIAWGLDYIAQTYGSPSAAWAHETADDWY